MCLILSVNNFVCVLLFVFEPVYRLFSLNPDTIIIITIIITNTLIKQAGNYYIITYFRNTIIAENIGFLNNLRVVGRENLQQIAYK